MAGNRLADGPRSGYRDTGARDTYTAGRDVGVLSMLDRLRRRRAHMLDAAGFAPVRSRSTIVHNEPGLTLHAFGPEGTGAPPLLIVPAPIKRPDIWDLEPEVSVVRRVAEAGIPVFMIEWTDPTGPAHDFDLADFADRLVATAVSVVRARTGAVRVALAGHSLGGTLAALQAGLHPGTTAGLLMIEAPLRFGGSSDALTPLVAASPRVGAFALSAGPMPGSALSLAAVGAAPQEFLLERWMDAMATAGDPATRATHLRVLRWTFDEFAMPGPLFADVLRQLYQEDAFAGGWLQLGGRSVKPADIGCPVFAVHDPGGRVVPPGAIVPVLKSVRGPVALRQWGPERGVAIRHVAALVGRRAHGELWPDIVGWLRGLPGGGHG